MNTVENCVKKDPAFAGSFFFYLFRCFGRFVFADLAACAEFRFLALGSALFALCAGHNIDDHFAAVHAGLRINAVSEVRIARLIARYARSGEPMMRTPFSGLGSVTSHSDYHSSAIIQILPFLARIPSKWAPNCSGALLCDVQVITRFVLRNVGIEDHRLPRCPNGGTGRRGLQHTGTYCTHPPVP